MSIFTLSHGRKTWLTFEAETIEAEKESEALVLHLSGLVAQQEENVAELCHHEAECFISLTEGDEAILEGRFRTSFLLFEANQIVVRLAAI